MFALGLALIAAAGTETGVIPADRSLLDPLVRRVCHDNAAEFLQLQSRTHHD